jgi:hypothetical protein
MAKAKTPIVFSPIGTAIHAWVNKPDTAFNNADGVFKVTLRLSGKKAAEFKTSIDGYAAEMLNNHIAEMTPKEAKKWTSYLPYEIVEDDDGNPTGEIDFEFKQNAIIRNKDGEERPISITIKDREDEPTDMIVYAGSLVRVAFRPRKITTPAGNQVGPRLDFSIVQVAQQAKRSGPKMGKISDEDLEDAGGSPAVSNSGPVEEEDGAY